MLWVVFTVAFYRILGASELLKTLHWSDIALSTTKMSVTLHQSNTDPFRKGQTIEIFQLVYPHVLRIRAMTIYSKIVKSVKSDAPVFCAGRFNLLTQQQLTKLYAIYFSREESTKLTTHLTVSEVVTTAATAGLPAWLVKTLGLWIAIPM